MVYTYIPNLLRNFSILHITVVKGYTQFINHGREFTQDHKVIFEGKFSDR